MNRIGHIDLCVRSLAAAYLFYARLLPALRYVHEWRDEAFFSFQSKGKLHRASWFGILQDPSHTPNTTRIVFCAGSVEEVDRPAAVVVSAGGLNIEGPENCPYSRIYCVVFFEDPSNNRLEIYYCEQ